MNTNEIDEASDEVLYAGLAAIGTLWAGTLLTLIGIYWHAIGAIVFGGLLLIMSALLMYTRWFLPIPDKLFIAISQARWSPDAKKWLIELVEQHGDKIRLKHFKEIEAIQLNYERSLDAEAQRKEKERALESLRH